MKIFELNSSFSSLFIQYPFLRFRLIIRATNFLLSSRVKKKWSKAKPTDHKIYHNYIIIRNIISRQALQKRPFSSPTFFDFFENWHNESFKLKTDIHFLFKPKSLQQKNYRVTNSIFHDFSIILSLITQRVISPETGA
jgi:hypothetical protein